MNLLPCTVVSGNTYVAMATWLAKAHPATAVATGPHQALLSLFLAKQSAVGLLLLMLEAVIVAIDRADDIVVTVTAGWNAEPLEAIQRAARVIEENFIFLFVEFQEKECGAME